MIHLATALTLQLFLKANTIYAFINIFPALGGVEYVNLRPCAI